MTGHIVMFSGGIGSWATAKRVAQRHGTDNLVLLFADVKGESAVDNPHIGEDEDLYRFIDDACVNIGVPLTRVADGRTIWEVFHDKRYLGNSRQANCSHLLKQVPCRKWLTEHYPNPADAIIYVGIDWSESHRLPAIRAGHAPYYAEAPMCDEPYLDKQQMIEWAESEGLRAPRLYSIGMPHNNCFGGETRVPTTEGVRTLRDLTEGPGEATVVTSQGWKWAKASSFGVQPLRPVTFVRSGVQYTVHATPDHRWPVEEYYFSPGSRRNSGNQRMRRTIIRTTSELTAGDRIARFPVPCRTWELHPDAVAHGIVYGDGSADTWSSRVLLCGAKAELEHWFPELASRIQRSNGLYVGKLPKTWKLPLERSERNPDLWGSFLAGWFAADGSLTAKSCTLSTCHEDNVELAVHAAAVAGVEVTNVLRYERTAYGITGPVWEIGLRMPEHLVLRASHRRNWKPLNFKLQRWTVADVGPVEPAEEVFCLTVPGPHDFALEYSLGCLNCGGGCVRAGAAQFARLLEAMPDRYREWERGEKEIRDYLEKDVTILRNWKAGGTPITLQRFRERIESQPALFGTEELFDPDEFGGCGCFTDTPVIE